ncbi:unnamed protein product [Moneuplotes crassus]|uniref:ATP synthase mitochondrial F1 complex assembly factor 1 n=1 Tax=Euplotes crassus TaxID=5936 RepID=A0AAD1Y0C3_EUPCR|nr:unnamed protein product [Moneuplotes crassus]
MFLTKRAYKATCLPCRQFSFNYPCPRNLREIMKMSLIEIESPETVKTIWSTYHKERKNTICHVFSATQYQQFHQNLTYAPIFLYPMKKPGGHYNLVSQAQNKSILFTTLEEYRQNPGSASPYLILTMYNELLISKGLGLMRGDIFGNFQGDEATKLMHMCIDSYMNESMYQYAKRFNHEPDRFNIEGYTEMALAKQV